jgi:hypothetical protein
MVRKTRRQHNWNWGASRSAVIGWSLSVVVSCGLGLPALARADGVCERLMKEATAKGEAQKWPLMLQAAEARQIRCPGPVSELLIGVARANLLDKFLVESSDRNLVREQALQSLQAAVASGALKSEWKATASDWIEFLEKLPEVSDEASEPPSDSEPDEAPPTVAPIRRPPPAPPFRKSPSLLGPVVTLSTGVALVGAGIITAVLAGNKEEDLERAALQSCRQMNPCDTALIPPSRRQELNNLEDESSSLYTWTNVLLIGGGITIAAGAVWYFLLPSGSESAAHVLLTPYVTDGRGGIRVGGRF